MTETRCIHRHTIKEHPSCFAKGRVKQVAVSRVQSNTEVKSWYSAPGMKIGYFDIESDGLRADFATMLSWAIKAKGGETTYDCVTKEDLFNGVYDERIIRSCVDTLKKYDIIITYYGTGFDIPFVRTKALHYGIDFPGYVIEVKSLKNGNMVQRYSPELYHWDLYYTVKSKLNLSKKSLDNACDFLGIKGKTPIEKDVWRRAKYGDPTAIEEVVFHNVQDVKILEELHDRIEFARKWIKSGI